MSFFLEFHEEVTRKITSLNLTTRLIHEILEHPYEELAEDPWGHIVRVPGQENPLLYSFKVTSEGSPPRDYLFEFALRVHSDEETLILLEIRLPRPGSRTLTIPWRRAVPCRASR